MTVASWKVQAGAAASTFTLISPPATKPGDSGMPPEKPAKEMAVLAALAAAKAWAWAIAVALTSTFTFLLMTMDLLISIFLELLISFELLMFLVISMFLELLML